MVGQSRTEYQNSTADYTGCSPDYSNYLNPLQSHVVYVIITMFNREIATMCYDQHKTKKETANNVRVKYLFDIISP